MHVGTIIHKLRLIDGESTAILLSEKWFLIPHLKLLLFFRLKKNNRYREYILSVFLVILIKFDPPPFLLVVVMNLNALMDLSNPELIQFSFNLLINKK